MHESKNETSLFWSNQKFLNLHIAEYSLVHVPRFPFPCPAVKTYAPPSLFAYSSSIASSYLRSFSFCSSSVTSVILPALLDPSANLLPLASTSNRSSRGGCPGCWLVWCTRVPVLSVTVDCVREVVWPLMVDEVEEKVWDMYEGILGVRWLWTCGMVCIWVLC